MRGMGAREKNFHANLVRRMGYAEAADKVQDLFFAGKRAEAAAAVPNEFADEISLVGPPARIRERLKLWKKSAVTTILAGTRDPAALRLLAEEQRTGTMEVLFTAPVGETVVVVSKFLASWVFFFVAWVP